MQPTVSYANPPQTVKSSAERRSEERQPCGRWACCTVSGSGESYCCRVENLCHNSIGLIMERAVRPGTSVFVSTPSAAELPRGQLIARVVHSTKQGKDGWLVGCRLYDFLTDQEFQTLLRCWQETAAPPTLRSTVANRT
jgi:PilZ domain